MRPSRILGPAVYLLGLVAGPPTLVVGCGGDGTPSYETTAPPRGEPSAEERKNREDAMKHAMQGASKAK